MPKVVYCLGIIQNVISILIFIAIQCLCNSVSTPEWEWNNLNSTIAESWEIEWRLFFEATVCKMTLLTFKHAVELGVTEDTGHSLCPECLLSLAHCWAPLMPFEAFLPLLNPSSCPEVAGHSFHNSCTSGIITLPTHVRLHLSPPTLRACIVSCAPRSPWNLGRLVNFNWPLQTLFFK